MDLTGSTVTNSSHYHFLILKLVNFKNYFLPKAEGTKGKERKRSMKSGAQ